MSTTTTITTTRKQQPIMQVTHGPQDLKSPEYATEQVDGPATSRRWAVCGIAAGVLGFSQFFLTGPLIVPTEYLADNQLIADALTDKAPFVWMYQVVGVATAMLIAIFAAGLFRRLSQQGPAQSLAPMVAVGGLFLVSAMQLVGSGICTEMFHGLRQDTNELDPDTLAAQMAILNTMPWVWVGAGLAAGAVAVLGLRHGAVGRGLAIGSVVATALIALVNIVPFQYLALVPGSLWMIGAGISFARRAN